MDKMKLNPFHTTDVRELSINGTTVAAGAAELDQFMLTGEIADISDGPASTWVVSPYAATIEKICTVTDGATTDAAAAITFEIGNVLVTGADISIVVAGSGAGVTNCAVPTAANTVAAGGAIEIITDGGSTGVTKAVVTLVMKRT